MVRLGRRVAVGLGRRLAFLRDGGGCRRVSAQLVLCRVVSMAAIVRGSGAWLRAGVAGGGPSGLPLLGVCSQETSTPCTWSMVAVAGKRSTTMRRGQCDGNPVQQQEAGAISGAGASGAHDRFEGSLEERG